MKTRIAPLTLGALFALHVPLSHASIDLFEYRFNIDGVISPPSPLPPGLNIGGFNTSSGLGTILFSQTGAGAHYFGTFVDHEIDEAVNTFFNEVGSVGIGVPSAGLSWEIDEPGFVFGDIFDNFQAGTLDNSVGTVSPEDVSMALAWSFVLASGETATIALHLSQTAPASGFYLQHSDPDSDESIYFSSSISIGPTETSVPDGGATFALLLVGLTTLAFPFRAAGNSSNNSIKP
jgi:hypothetical protein